MEEEKLNHEQVSDDHENPVLKAEAIKEEPHPQTTENSEQNPTIEETDADEEEWVTGIKSIIILITLTVAAFLVLLDTSIVATVSI
jgi:hypothetical protein